MAGLFDSVTLGDLTLRNRIVMSALTRCRAQHPGGLATPEMAEYYALRADAGLILSEGIPVTPRGVGYVGVSGLWTREQTASWRQVTEAVHGAGGLIMAQLWHVGRLTDPAFISGNMPMGPSAVPAEGSVTRLRPEKPWEVPRAMDQVEIDMTVSQFAQAADNAREAGFDGIDLHGANGYLIDQFLQNGANRRQDDYGGSIPNRMRLLSEIVEAVTEYWAPGRIAVHLSPRDGFSMSDSDPGALFVAVAEMLRGRVGFLYLREEQRADAIGPAIRRAFGGPVVVNSRLTPETAAQVLAEGRAEAVGFGRGFIANPDLVTRLREGRALRPADPARFYDGGRLGYLDLEYLDMRDAPAQRHPA